MFNILFDESILVRELRRWRSQGRWKFLLVPVLIGLLLFYSAYPGFYVADAGRSVEETPQVAWFLAGILALASLVSLFQAREVLRREIGEQTIESLLLTLQRERPVMRAVVLSGVTSGGTYLLLFLPLILIVCLGWGIRSADILAYLLMTGSCLFVASAVGCVWLFVSSGLYESSVPAWKVAAGIGAFVGLLMASTAGVDLSHAASVFMSNTAVFAAALAVLGSCVVLLRYASGCKSPKRLEIAILVCGLLAFALVSGSLFLLKKTIQLSDSGAVWMLLCPVVQAAICGQNVSTPQQFESIPIPNLPPLHNVSWLLAMAACSFLIGAAIVVKSFELYTRLRIAPERAIRFSSTKLKVFDVGRDEWRGFTNPVLTRELRTRLRSGDALTFIGIATMLSVGAAAFPLVTSIDQSIQATQLASYARDSFIALGVMQLIIVFLVAPGLGAEVIAAEKERKTFEMLKGSLLNAEEILRGKAAGVLALLALMLSPGLPLLAFTAFLHATSALNVLLMVLLSATFATVLTMISVSLSAICRSSVAAKWQAYGIGLLLLVTTAPLTWHLASKGNPSPQTSMTSFGICALLLWLFVTCLWLWGVRSVECQTDRRSSPGRSLRRNAAVAQNVDTTRVR